MIDLFSVESRLKRTLRAHLREVGFKRDDKGGLVPPGDDKDSLRAAHAIRRAEVLRRERFFIREALADLSEHFANGSEVDPRRVAPRLEVVRAGTWQSDLFRLASLTWSMPVSQGYGRRFRMLVWDKHNGRLIGLLALGDPVFNLRARDEWVGWSVRDRTRRLVNVLDAFVLGAVPPYNFILGGKLVAALVKTREVRAIFARRYAAKSGVISKRRKYPSLVLVTTTSAFGRSSLYNRLRLDGSDIFTPIGFTSGYGHFHVPDALFREMRDYLDAKKHPYANGFRFGNGPSWRLRVIRVALSMLGMSPALLRHGIKREVFVCEMAANARGILAGAGKRAKLNQVRSVDEVARLARERWLVPRAQRRPEFASWARDDLKHLFDPTANSTAVRGDGTRKLRSR